MDILVQACSRVSEHAAHQYRVEQAAFQCPGVWVVPRARATDSTTGASRGEAGAPVVDLTATLTVVRGHASQARARRDHLIDQAHQQDVLARFLDDLARVLAGEPRSG